MGIEEYEDRIIEKFNKKNQNLKLTISFGSPNESFELSLNDDLFKYDIFFFNKHNKTHQFIPYFENQFLFR
jgi:hypothetical protein